MKVFVADIYESGHTSANNFHWTNNNDMLFFCIYNCPEYRYNLMTGINSLKSTTHIIVKDIKMEEYFYKELIQNAIELALNKKFDKRGDVSYFLLGKKYKLNIDQFVFEHITSANQFNDGDKISMVDGFPKKVKVRSSTIK
jgi:hypothetical protein